MFKNYYKTLRSNHISKCYKNYVHMYKNDRIRIYGASLLVGGMTMSTINHFRKKTYKCDSNFSGKNVDFTTQLCMLTKPQ